MKKKFKRKAKNKSLCKKNIYFLNYLNSLPRNKQKKLIEICSKQECNSLIEIFINFLNRNVRCKQSFIKNMKKHSLYFKKLSNKGLSVINKKRLLVSRKGGFILKTLLSLALPIISKLFL